MTYMSRDSNFPFSIGVQNRRLDFVFGTERLKVTNRFERALKVNEDFVDFLSKVTYITFVSKLSHDMPFLGHYRRLTDKREKSFKLNCLSH